ncbi:Tetraspanin-11 [Pseudolycoriella hygida]|uniref:Tetraspanin n=1 Tax=Pseudolycoriella hygida TaxID=35572 RepID=A0A9Q0S6V4_9DIPT|nr:Tetraspanin-11 [Pseudolycoriella hygida]
MLNGWPLETIKMSGVLVTVVSIWTLFWKHQYTSLLPTRSYVIGTYALLAAGCLSVLGSLIGLCGICRQFKTLVLLYIYLLLMVFLLEANVGGLAYIYENQVTEDLQQTLNTTFLENYGIDEEKTNAIDRMQQEYTCCGAFRFEDWRYSHWLRSERTDLLRTTNNRLVPDSCCITMSERCGIRDHPSNIPYTGCVYKFLDELRDHLNIVAAVGSGICVVQIFGMVLAIILYIKLRNVDK